MLRGEPGGRPEFTSPPSRRCGDRDGTAPDGAEGERYAKLARLHRRSVALPVSLATKLRRVPSSRLDRRLPQDGDLPVA